MPITAPASRVERVVASGLWADYFRSRFELARGGTAHHLRPMEGLRGLAVLMVFLVHYVTLVEPRLAPGPVQAFANGLRGVGNTGVDLFFVLSGYLIYGSLIEREQRFFAFMGRRIRRIYPAFIAVFSVYLLLSAVVPAESKIPRDFVPALGYLAANLLLLPGLFPIEPVITVAWSLSYEMAYYLALPGVILALRLRRRSPGWRASLFVAGAIAGLLCGAATGGHIRLVMFVAGILLYEVQASRDLLPLPDGVTGLLGALGLVAGPLCMLLPWPDSQGFAARLSILFIAYFFLCCACLRRASGPLDRIFTWLPLRWLGNMSYSYYLLHGLALKAAFMAMKAVAPERPTLDALGFFVLLPCLFLVTLVPTTILFLTVERPFSLTPRRA